MQPRDLGGERLWVAMPPARPEAALTAVIAKMRTAARELHHDGAFAAPIAIAAVVDQLPANTIVVEIADHRRRRRRDGRPVLSKRDAQNFAQRTSGLDRPRQLADGVLTL